MHHHDRTGPGRLGTGPRDRRRRRLLGTLLGVLALVGCRCAPPGLAGAAPEAYPPAPASPAFWIRWADGQAELSSYRLTTPRYGEPRSGTAVLVYVLEEMDRETWIKNDRGTVPDERRTVVMKLNHAAQFQTGVYPYSVMTSVFSPVGVLGRERFAPTRIVLTSQEWCGQVYHRIMPRADRFESELRSYFSSEGEISRNVSTRPYALYEDALLIQLRELDDPFAGGGDWSGDLVPSLWHMRRTHRPLAPVPATIERSDGTLENGIPVTRFDLRYDGLRRTFEVEKSWPRRILRWMTSEGELAELVETERLRYWEQNAEADETYRQRFGLQPRGWAVLGEGIAAATELD
jgi:hypothetical protein